MNTDEAQKLIEDDILKNKIMSLADKWSTQLLDAEGYVNSDYMNASDIMEKALLESMALKSEIFTQGGRTKMNWISVKDGLPETGEKVVVWVKPGCRGYWSSAVYREDKKYKWVESDYDRTRDSIYDFFIHDYNITHWAEITPPKEGD